MDNKTKRSGWLLPVRMLMLLCVMGILWSAHALFSSAREYARGDAAYEQIRLLAEPDGAGGAARPPEAAAIPPDPAESPELPEQKRPDFTALQQINSDVAAWISAGNRVIDYPVVQGRDNEYYLTRLVTGETNKLGSLFMDYRNGRDFSGPNTVIYGHNMKDGSMFSALTHYRQQAYYQGMPVMHLYTPGQNYRIDLFAGMLSDASYTLIRFAFSGPDDYLAYIDGLKSRSDFQSDIAVAAEDRIVTLSTCSYEADNARYLLFGKLTPVE